MSKLTKKIIAMLLSGILVLGSATSSVLAASIDLDPNQTSEIAEEVYDKDTSEAPAGARESYPEEASANEEAVEYYTVTLDANGGYFEHEWDDVLEETVENTEVLNKTIPFGGIVEIVPVKDSATFLGWRLELDGEVLGAEYAPKENCTLYAAWQMEDGVIEGETTGVVPAVDEVPAEEGDPVEDVIEEELPAEEADGQETIDEGDVQEEEFVDDFEQFDAEQDTEVAAESETDELDPTQDAETAEVEETDAQYNAEGTAQVTSEAQEPEPENAEVGESAATSQIMDTKAKEQDATPEQDETAMIDAGEEYVSTDAAMEVVASGWCGDNLSWTLDDAGTLTISGTGEMWDYDYDDNHVYYGETSDFRYLYSSFEKVILENGVTSIGKAAFASCYRLTSLTIPDSVESIGRCAFEKCTGLTNVTFGNSVTSIGELAFYGCSDLPSVTIPDSVESIWRYAFAKCSGLTNVTFGNSVRSIEDYAFYGCSSLPSVTIPDNVLYIGKHVFRDCTSLRNVIIPVWWPSDRYSAFWNTPWEQGGCLAIKNNILVRCLGGGDIIIPDGVTCIGESAFYDNGGLQSVTIPVSVTSIKRDAFTINCVYLKEVHYEGSKQEWDDISIEEGNDYLTDAAIYYAKNPVIERGQCGDRLTWMLDDTGTLTISGTGEMWFYDSHSCIFNNYEIKTVKITKGVTSIGKYAFYGCIYLQNVTISKNVTSIGDYAFDYCSSLTNVTIPNSVTSIGKSVFCDCSRLTSVTIPNSVTSIGECAFIRCRSLTSVTIPDSVTSIGDHAFCDCSSLESVTIPGSVGSIDESVFKDCTSLTSVTIPESVTSIEDYTFYGCSSLMSVTIPDSVTSIGAEAFKYCSALKTVTIPNSVTSIGAETFQNCGLTSVIIPDSVMEIGFNAFENCISLTSVTIPDSVTSIKSGTFQNCISLTSVTVPNSVWVIGDHAFCACSSLESVTIPDSVTNIKDWAFCNCTSLASVTIPDSVTSIGGSVFSNCRSLESVTIPDSVTSIGMCVFNECYKLKSVNIPDSVMDIWGYAFMYCTSLTSVTIPNSVTSIEAGTFQYCRSLESVTISDSVTSIGNSAFRDCSSLTSVSIPDSVTSIGESAFRDCSSLASVSIPDGVTSIGEGAFSDCPDALVIYGTIGSYAEQYAKNNNITFKVNSKQISGVIVTGLPTMTYNGRAQTPAPVVKIGSTTLKANTDYTVSYKNNTYAGTATVTITGIGNYEGTVTATFTIKKAAQTMTAKAAASSIAVGKTTTVSITGAKGTKSFKSSDISIATVDKSTGKLTAKKVGTVKITATSAATANYKAASKTVTIKVVPAATASLTATNLSSGIKLTWKKVTGATGYLVYRGSTKIATIKSGSSVTYTDTKANTNGTKYTYKIIATASTGNGPAKSVTTYCVARPAISSVANSASKRMTVKWGKNAKASGYQIHYCMDKTFKTGNKSVSVTSAATVSKAIASLTKGKTYYVRIRTYKTVGSTKYFSAWSPVKSVKISK